MYIIIITANDEEQTIVGEAIEPGLQEYDGRPDATVCRSDGAR